MAKKKGHTYAPFEEADKKRKLNRSGVKKLFKILSFIRPYKGYFGMGMVFLVFSTFASLTFPYLAGKLIDASTGKLKWEVLNSIDQISLVLITILLFQAVISFFRIYLFAIVSEKTMADIRSEVYRKIITLPIFFFEKRRVGELTSRITSDVSQLQSTLSTTLAEFFRQVATLVVGIGIILTTSTQLTLLMLSTFPVLMLVAVLFGRFIRKLSKESQDALAKANVVVEETLQTIHIVKAFTSELFEWGRYKGSLKETVHYALKASKFRGAFVSFIIFALFGGIVLVLWYGAGLVADGSMTEGELTAFIIYTAFIGGSVGGIGDLYSQLQRSIGASERLLEILDEESEIQLDDDVRDVPVKGSISFKNVSFSYPTREDVQVLKDISFEISSGETLALVGQSGAGKSTIIQLLMKYYPYQKGEIFIDDLPLKSIPTTSFRRKIAIVPQEVILFGGSIKENIAYGNPSAREEDILLAAEKANALNFINNFPDGMDTRVGERGIQLSGGQKQRIAIARAILNDPKILILDEATSSLDAESEKLIQEALEKVMKNRTTIVIAHRLATIRKADKIAVLEQGKITEIGSHRELIEKNGIYHKLMKLQLEAYEA